MQTNKIKLVLHFTVHKFINSKFKVMQKSNVSTYEKNVLAPNREMKKESKTFGGVLSILLLHREIHNKTFMSVVLEAKKNPDFYKYLQTLVDEKTGKPVFRTSKKGNYGTFAVLQGLNKRIEQLNEKRAQYYTARVKPAKKAA